MCWQSVKYKIWSAWWKYESNQNMWTLCWCAAPRIGLSSFERNIDLSYIVGLYIVIWRCLDSREDRGCRRSLCSPVFSDPLSAPQHQKLLDGHRLRVCRLWGSFFHKISILQFTNILPNAYCQDFHFLILTRRISWGIWLIKGLCLKLLRDTMPSPSYLRLLYANLGML